MERDAEVFVQRMTSRLREAALAIDTAPLPPDTEGPAHAASTRMMQTVRAVQLDPASGLLTLQAGVIRGLRDLAAHEHHPIVAQVCELLRGMHGALRRRARAGAQRTG